MNVAWLSDGSGLIMTARTDVTQSDYQLWHISYPDGEARMIYNDLNSYESVSLAADDSALVTVQSKTTSNYWVVPVEGTSDGFPMDVSRARQIMPLPGWYPDPNWTPDGKIVFTSPVSGNQDIWIMDADGSHIKQLTVDPGYDIWPAVSPDGRYIVFSSRQAIWRMNLDGTNLKQVGENGILARCSPDGRWIVYTSPFNKFTVWKIPIDGGDAVPLGDKSSRNFAISPDGKLLAMVVHPSDSRSIVEIIPFEGGSPTKTFELPRGITFGLTQGKFHWSPDGRALTYVLTHGGVSNIWSQPVEGGEPVQLTDFKSDLIFHFDWSRDGKQLVLARGQENRDVVLMRDSR
jgi:Tol biopolymer transport system component